MCYACYEEAGKPQIINEKTQKTAEMIKELYAMPDGCVGGHAHIVLDDWNLDTEDISYCLKEAMRNAYDFDTKQTQLEANILYSLLHMTEDERHSTLAIAKGIVS